MTLARGYLLYGLESSPLIMKQLMKTASPEILDRQPDPERFSLRGILAHMADWEGIWLDRLQRLMEKEGAEIKGRDPDEVASLRDYRSADIEESLEQFAQRRAELLTQLKSLDEPAWKRKGIHNEAGPYSIHDLAQFALGHDGYHLKQMVEWIEWK